jgi:hypothetical protein
MKKVVTQLLYVFSFSLLFTAIYLNISQEANAVTAYGQTEKKPVLSQAALSEQNAVAQPENNTVLK